MKLILLIPLAIAWYNYLSSHTSSVPYLVVLIAATLYLVLGIYLGLRRSAAANNVVAAAATWETLSLDDRKRVHICAIDAIRDSGWRGATPPSFENDVQRFGWYALSMGILGIHPVCVTKGWNHVRNPFLALPPADTNIDTVIALASKEGFAVKISRNANSAADPVA